MWYSPTSVPLWQGGQSALYGNIDLNVIWAKLFAGVPGTKVEERVSLVWVVRFLGSVERDIVWDKCW